MPQIVILAPNLALRLGLRALLSNVDQIHVVGEAAHIDEVEALRDAGEEVDVIVCASPFSGETAISGLFFPDQETKAASPAVLLLSDDLEEVEQLLAFEPTVWGVISVDAPVEELNAAIQALAEGLLVGSPHLMGHLLSSSPQAKLQPGTTEALTARESEVLQLIAQGLANKQIAVQLGISEHTVKFHVSSIYSKLGVTNRTEAVRTGVRGGLITL